MNNNSIRIGNDLVIPLSELRFHTSRSGGPGGQNVNKVESRVELLFDIKNTPTISPDLKTRLFEKLHPGIDSEGILHIVSQASRSQWENKQDAIKKLERLIRSAMRPARKRVPTNPTKASREKRLRRKKILSEKKRMRSGRGDN